MRFRRSAGVSAGAAAAGLAVAPAPVQGAAAELDPEPSTPPTEEPPPCLPGNAAGACAENEMEAVQVGLLGCELCSSTDCLFA